MAVKEKKTFTIDELAGRIGAEVIGDGKVEICGVNSLDQASGTDITFISSDKHADKLSETSASAVIVKERVAGAGPVQLLVEDVDSALIDVLNLFAPQLTVEAGVHATAVVEESAEIGDNVSIGAGVYVAHGVSVGDGCILGAGCVVGENTKIGMNSILDANVVVYRNCVIGNNCIIQANSTIGACGFGYSFIDAQHKLVPHNGGVIIEDSVDVGANCTIDRAKFGNTIVGAGTKIDNLVMIAHNVVIGKCCLIIAQVGMAGSSKLSNGVIVAGQAGIGDHVKVGDGATVTGKAVVTKNVAPGDTVFGCPARDFKEGMRIHAHQQRLPEMSRQLKDMIKRVESLEAAKDDKK